MNFLNKIFKTPTLMHNMQILPNIICDQIDNHGYCLKIQIDITWVH
jgi:hypothetical protein